MFWFVLTGLFFGAFVGIAIQAALLKLSVWLLTRREPEENRYWTAFWTAAGLTLLSMFVQVLFLSGRDPTLARNGLLLLCGTYVAVLKWRYQVPWRYAFGIWLGWGLLPLVLVLGMFLLAGLGMVTTAALSSPTGANGEPPAAVAKGPLSPEAAESLGLTPWGTVESTPPGAKVFIDGAERGVTPLRTRFTAARNNAVHVELEGYFSQDRGVEPNTNEEAKVTMLLRRAASLKISSTPPGAKVTQGNEAVLASTPGLTVPLEPGSVDLTVSLEGYQPLRLSRDLAGGEAEVDVTLEPGVKVAVASEPPGAEVRLDEAYVGKTPLTLFVSKKGKHTLVFSKDALTPVTRQLAKLKGGEKVAVQLVDADLVAVQKRLAKARADYEVADAKLNKLQRKMEHLMSPTRAAEAELGQAEKVMERASTALEEAEAELREAEESRGIAPTPVMQREPRE